MRQYIKRPWLTRDGRIKADWEIKRLSRSWDKNIWEAYLEENIELKRKESLYGPSREIAFISAEDAQTMFDSLGESVQCDYLFEEIKTLPNLQRKIISCLYWENFNIAEAARILGFSRPKIYKNRDKALENLKVKLCVKIVDLNIKKIFKLMTALKRRGLNEKIAV